MAVSKLNVSGVEGRKNWDVIEIFGFRRYKPRGVEAIGDLAQSRKGMEQKQSQLNSGGM
ncbi:MAG: hypothetical protein F6J87_18665 [Spirulina sp. SIO3F2]|nr:hypothetical protein [Spirulina sp. SIO3F2]